MARCYAPPVHHKPLTSTFQHASFASGGADSSLPRVGSKRRRESDAPSHDTIVDRVERQQKAFKSVAARLGWQIYQSEKTVDEILQVGPCRWRSWRRALVGVGRGGVPLSVFCDRP